MSGMVVWAEVSGAMAKEAMMASSDNTDSFVRLIEITRRNDAGWKRQIAWRLTSA